MSSPSSSLLSRLPYKARVLSGLVLANDTTDAMNDLTIQSGYACDDTGTPYFLPAQLIKRLDANFAPGNNAGFIGTGLTKAPNTTYHILMIRNATTDATDVYADTSVSGANKPAGWEIVCRLGSLYTNATAAPNSAWVQFRQTHDMFSLLTVFSTTLANTASNIAITSGVPMGVNVKTMVNFFGDPLFNGSNYALFVQSPVNLEYYNVTAGRSNTSAVVGFLNLACNLLTNTSGQILYNAANLSVITYTGKGWIDARGKDV